MMQLPTLDKLGDPRGRRVIVRVDWNVPIEDARVTDDERIRASLQTLEYLRQVGARIIILSHLAPDEASLEPVHQTAAGLFPHDFCADLEIEKIAARAKALSDGEALLLENLRQHPGEKQNNPSFAGELAALGDAYVNEAFSASHRSHASIVGLAERLPSYVGFRFEKEVTNLSKALAPVHPFLFILGGAKFETKLPLLDKFVGIADALFVGGALAHNFFKFQGIDIKKSLVSAGDFDIARLLESQRIILPRDPVWDGERIVDAGEATLEDLRARIGESKFILWNGPLGLYEAGFKEGTQALAKIIAESGQEAIVGGADTLAAIKELGISEKFSFVSTAGGAMLDFLATGTLPGIEALKRSPGHSAS